VRAGLLQVYEQWNGKGGPNEIAGESIALTSRIAQVALTVSLFHALGGPDAAVEAVRRRAGKALDPQLAALVSKHARRVTGILGSADPLTAVVSAEPAPQVRVSALGMDRVSRALGEAVDLKAPIHQGHSTGVAELAAGAAGRVGLGSEEVATLRRAGFLHDLGRAAVRNGVWERPGPLSWSEQELVRLHPHYSERVIARCGPLAPLASVAGAHHERLDGSGYHRQLAAGAQDISSRVLAAADVFQAMTQLGCPPAVRRVPCRVRRLPGRDP
jgi:HD-GYP domain-containing protein (c-di-GMP phosphodiesterase class II)